MKKEARSEKEVIQGTVAMKTKYDNVELHLHS